MPFSCARELCTRFCFNIAGALIPIFGPSFPSECIEPRAPGFANMAISQETIQFAIRDSLIPPTCQQPRIATGSPAVTSHPFSFVEPTEVLERPRTTTWSEPPSNYAGELTKPKAMELQYWGSRPNTREGPGGMGYMATPRSTPKWLAYASPQEEPLPFHEYGPLPRSTLDGAPLSRPLNPRPLSTSAPDPGLKVTEEMSPTGTATVRLSQDEATNLIDDQPERTVEKRILAVYRDNQTQCEDNDVEMSGAAARPGAALEVAQILIDLRYGRDAEV